MSKATTIYVGSDNARYLRERLKELPVDAPVLLEVNDTTVAIVFDRIAMVTTEHSGEKQEAAVLRIVDQEYLDKMKAVVAAK